MVIRAGTAGTAQADTVRYRAKQGKTRYTSFLRGGMVSPMGLWDGSHVNGDISRLQPGDPLCWSKRVFRHCKIPLSLPLSHPRHFNDPFKPSKWPLGGDRDRGERARGVLPVALRKPDKCGCKSLPLSLSGILMPSRGEATLTPLKPCGGEMNGLECCNSNTPQPPIRHHCSKRKVGL